MTSGRASRTAEIVALFRAIESCRPPAVRLFHDPFAHHFLSPPARVVHALSCLPVFGEAVPWVIDRGWGGPFGSAVCRTRFIDDAVEAALGAGVEQVVILGAGFDCRPYRIAGIERTRVFEVDHPATQGVKRARMAGVLGGLPAHVAFVPIDFNREALADALDAAGFHRDRLTFTIWEGVTNYLTAEAVDATFRELATAGALGSTVVFTYIHRGVLDGTGEFAGSSAWLGTVRRLGETFTFGFNPTELSGYLAARRLKLLDDVGPDEYRARYLTPRGRGLGLGAFYRAAVARTR